MWFEPIGLCCCCCQCTKRAQRKEERKERCKNEDLANRLGWQENVAGANSHPEADRATIGLAYNDISTFTRCGQTSICQCISARTGVERIRAILTDGGTTNQKLLPAYCGMVWSSISNSSSNMTELMLWLRIDDARMTRCTRVWTAVCVVRRHKAYAHVCVRTYMWEYMGSTTGSNTNVPVWIVKFMLAMADINFHSWRTDGYVMQFFGYCLLSRLPLHEAAALDTRSYCI